MAKPNPVPGHIPHPRLWRWVDVGQLHQCWEWRGKLSPNGYGRMMFRGTAHMSHRVAYALMRGPIPEGLVIDHLCRNRACCNPWHLEPVTNGENVRRGEVGRKKTAPRGHGEYAQYQDGCRCDECRKANAERGRRDSARRRMERQAA